MREIKFRAWDAQMGHWAHIDLDEWKSSTGPRASITNESIPQLFEIISDESYIWNQGSGLIDRSGVEIYEGDILENLHGDVRHVVFLSGMFMSSYPGLTEGTRVEPLNYIAGVCDVIGNIYENPELLEKS